VRLKDQLKETASQKNLSAGTSDTSTPDWLLLSKFGHS